MKTVFASVVCDLLHVGHLNFLRESRQLGSRLYVGVLTDRVVETYKRKPIIDQDERLDIVQSLWYVYDAFLQDQLDPQPWLDDYNIDVIVHGDDWKDDFPGAEYMRSIWKQAVNIPYYHFQSTTKIIEEVLRRHREVKA